MNEEGTAMLTQIWQSLGQSCTRFDRFGVTGHGHLPSVYAVTDLAVASIGAATLAVAELLGRRGTAERTVTIDRDLASRWFARTIEPVGWTLPPSWDSIAGDYPSRDGWIKLHTNAPHHRRAALRALGLDPDDAGIDRSLVARAAVTRDTDELESAVLQAGGCAARMRTAQAWQVHPQGRAVAVEPLLAFEPATVVVDPPPQLVAPAGVDRPLAGIRVLDLTRILAGPVATRFLAGYGAEVLRIDPIDWDEPMLAPEVTLGKRRARLDLRSTDGRRVFERLLSGCDVLVHGYRSDALERLGLGVQRRRELNPGLVDVCLDAYGWTGDWRTRRGFDSLVQMSAGIAEAGMSVLARPVPTPLPVQALDHATGYLMAAAVLRGLIDRIDTGRGSCTRASLARTAALLTEVSQPRRRDDAPALRAVTADDFVGTIENTAWGPARRLRAPYEIDGAPAHWMLAAGPLGDGQPRWDAVQRA